MHTTLTDRQQAYIEHVELGSQMTAAVTDVADTVDSDVTGTEVMR